MNPKAITHVIGRQGCASEHGERVVIEGGACVAEWQWHMGLRSVLILRAREHGGGDWSFEYDDSLQLLQIMARWHGYRLEPLDTRVGAAEGGAP